MMPLDVRTPGQMEAVFERIATDWGKLDFVVHSIAFSPKEALQGRVSAHSVASPLRKAD
jgi:enoyl-[acyl-carrier protein] reductase I